MNLIECNSNNDILKGLLTIGNKYRCVAINSIGDCKIDCDDKGNSKWYKIKFFKDFYKNVDTNSIEYFKAKI